MGNACGCADNRTSIEKQVDSTLFMLRRCPDLRRYGLSKERTSTFTYAWGNSQFGGSVLAPLGAYGKRRSRTNPLEEQINAAQVNSLYGGGFYVLEKVQLYNDDTHYYVDIYLLVESVEDQEQLALITELNQRYAQSLLPKS